MRRILKYFITLCYRLKNLGKSRISSSAIILRGCQLEGHNSVGNNTYLSGTSLGYGSFMGFGDEFSNCKIGRFCSIGSNIRVVSATHPVKGFISTHPAFFSDSYWFHYVKQSKFKEHLTNASGTECTIGNDVWIGDNCLILGETVLKVKVPPVRIENSLLPLYRGTDFSTLAETFKTVWGG